MTNPASNNSLPSPSLSVTSNVFEAHSLGVAKQIQQRKLTQARLGISSYLEACRQALSLTTISESNERTALHTYFGSEIRKKLRLIAILQSPAYLTLTQDAVLLNILRNQESQMIALGLQPSKFESPKPQPIPPMASSASAAPISVSAAAPTTAVSAPAAAGRDNPLPLQSRSQLLGKHAREIAAPPTATAQAGTVFSATEELAPKKTKVNGSTPGETQVDLSAPAPKETDRAIQEFIKIARENKQFSKVSSPDQLARAMTIYQTGVDFLEHAGDIEKALDCFQRAAQIGHVGAGFVTGFIYCQHPSSTNLVKGVTWLESTAKAGSGKAEALLRLMLQQGKIVTRMLL